uniref:Wax synthase domain-containing protein n=1 Tax=Kalanchoe fedtschenkoi TaxID=63787 RepID=A0A7N0VBK9_KALFE
MTHYLLEASDALFQNPSILLLLSLAHAHIFLNKVLLHGPSLVRLAAVIPTIYIFSVIPWSFPSALIRGLLSYFITWIASFKLLAFCFRRTTGGPRVIPTSTASSFLDFATIAIFPFKPNEAVKDNAARSIFWDVAPLAWLVTLLNLYILIIQRSQTTSNYHFSILLFYLAAVFSWQILVRFMTRYEVVPVFDKPYLATSLREFWGKRWNKYSSFMLRLTVYDPARTLLNRCVGITSARLTATLVTLAVSGVMHELMAYYITCGKKPTWEASWYFVLQGVSMWCESLLKYVWLRVLRWRPIRPITSMLLVDGFVVASFYLFIFKPISKSGQNQC